MINRVANAGFMKYFIILAANFLLVRSYVNINSHRGTSLQRFMSEKPPVVSSTVKRQFNFKELIEKCSETAVYTTAVRAAAQYLHSSESLTQSGVNSVIKIYGLAAMVDDAVEALSIAESKGVTLNVRHYNAVINVCRKHKRYDDALLVYERLLASSAPTSSAALSYSPSLSSSESKKQLTKHLSLSPDIATTSR